VTGEQQDPDTLGRQLAEAEAQLARILADLETWADRTRRPPPPRRVPMIDWAGGNGSAGDASDDDTHVTDAGARHNVL
jgi:hypothetical protein